MKFPTKLEVEVLDKLLKQKCKRYFKQNFWKLIVEFVTEWLIKFLIKFFEIFNRFSKIVRKNYTKISPGIQSIEQ